MSQDKAIFGDGAIEAVRDLLVTLGEEPSRNGLLDTPQRVTKAWKEMTRSEGLLESAVGDAIFDLEAFEGDPGWVTVKHIPFAAISSETLLPYHGVCHVAYKIGRNKILGLSKAARIIQMASKGIKGQQQLVDLVKKTIETVTQSIEVAVISTATHIYYDRPIVVRTISSVGDRLKHDQERCEELMTLLGLDGLKGEQQRLTGFDNFVVDPSVVAKMQSSMMQLFNRLAIIPDQDALHQYCHQLFCATTGQSKPVMPAEIQNKADCNDVTADHPVANISCTIDFRSLCEHHLLPFYGKFFIGCKARSLYETLTSSKLKSSLAKAVGNHAHRLQVQERLTNDIADVAMKLDYVEAVIVVCEAVHMCMIARGAKTHASVTRTVTRRGTVPRDLMQQSNEAIKF